MHFGHSLMSWLAVAMCLVTMASAFHVKWSRDYNFSFPTGFGSIQPPIVGNTFIAFDENNNLVALDIRTGDLLWQSNATGSGSTIVSVVYAGANNNHLVIVGNQGFFGFITVMHPRDGSIAWTYGYFDYFLDPATFPIVASGVVLVCSGLPCNATGFDLATGKVVFTNTVSPLVAMIDCGGTVALGVLPADANNISYYGALDVASGQLLWHRDTASGMSPNVVACNAHVYVRVDFLTAHVGSMQTGTDIFQAEGTSFALGGSVLCAGFEALEYGCWDETTGFVVMNATTLPGTASALTYMAVTDGELQLSVQFPYGGTGPTYVNFTNIDISTGTVLSSFVPPSNAQYAALKGPNGNWIVPYLNGITVWDHQGRFVTRTTTVPGITFLAASATMVVAGYGNTVTGFSF